MGIKGYKRKLRGKETRKRTKFVFISAEGKNKTETNYFRQFNSKTTQFKFVSGKTTDPVNMSKDLMKKMKSEGFDIALGDCAFCLIDGDNAIYKDQQIAEADNLAKQNRFKIILSNPCFEIWFICHYCLPTKQYKSNKEVIEELKQYIPHYAKNIQNIKVLLSDKLLDAIENAMTLEKRNIEFGRKKHTVEFQPSTEVYQIFNLLSHLNDDRIE